MERLTEKTKDGIAYTRIPLNRSSIFNESDNRIECYTGYIVDKLAKYEDLEEQGRLHIAPIKNGTEIFYPFKDLLSDEDIEEEVIESTYVYGLTEWEWGEMNKDWFLTREEAEKALEAENEMQGL